MKIKLISGLKRGSAILLLICFFMPLSQCTQKVAPEGAPAVTKADTVISAYSAYAWPSIGSSVALLLFSWPAIGQVIALRRQAFSSPRIVAALELVLSILTACGISLLVMWGDRIQYGAFVAYGATITYCGATLWGLLSTRPNSPLKWDVLKNGP